MGWNFLFPFAAAPCFCWPPEKIFGVKKHQIFVWCSLTAAHAGGGRLLKTFPPKIIYYWWKNTGKCNVEEERKTASGNVDSILYFSYWCSNYWLLNIHFQNLYQVYWIIIFGIFSNVTVIVIGVQKTGLISRLADSHETLSLKIQVIWFIHIITYFKFVAANTLLIF